MSAGLGLWGLIRGYGRLGLRLGGEGLELTHQGFIS